MTISKLSIKTLHKATTHKETLIKFLLLVIILIAYFGYLSWEYGIETGGIVSALTWSFFVLCTPVADAGFLIAFPVRLLFGIRMVTTIAITYVIAILLNIILITINPDIYSTTFMTSLLYKILTVPYPYYSIIVLSTIGTFLSIYFGDEMLDVAKHKDCAKQHKHGFKYRVIATISLFVLIILSYYYLLSSLNIKIE